MDQQLDAFTQRRFELMIEMAVRKLQQEINSLKEHISSLNSEIGSLKSQISRSQFQPQYKGESSELRPACEVDERVRDELSHLTARTLAFNSEGSPKVEIIDCRPKSERKEDFVSGSSKNSEPLKPRYGDYKPEDVSIDKFFYFGRK